MPGLRPAFGPGAFFFFLFLFLSSLFQTFPSGERMNGCTSMGMIAKKKKKNKQRTAWPAPTNQAAQPADGGLMIEQEEASPIMW
jgi:hypothetical protein